MAALDGTEEGQREAAKAREAAKRKRQELDEKGVGEAPGEAPPAKKTTATPTHTILHEVEIPSEYLGNERQLDPALYGKCTSFCSPHNAAEHTQRLC